MERGEIWHVDLNPTRGNEQQGARYVLIISTRSFNRLGAALVCPITQGGNFARHQGFAVSLSGSGTNAQGVILCNQLRVVDLKARGGRVVETVPDFIIDEVLAKIQAIID